LGTEAQALQSGDKFGGDGEGFAAHLRSLGHCVVKWSAARAKRPGSRTTLPVASAPGLGQRTRRCQTGRTRANHDHIRIHC